MKLECEFYCRHLVIYDLTTASKDNIISLIESEYNICFDYRYNGDCLIIQPLTDTDMVKILKVLTDSYDLIME